MIIIAGLVILVAALVVGIAGVLSNAGSAHALTHGFAVFGYHVTGSTGTLFLYGIVVGAIALAGLSLLLAGAHTASALGNGTPRSASSPGPGEGWRRLFARRAAPRPAPAEPPEPLAGQPAPDATAGTPAPAGHLTNGSHP